MKAIFLLLISLSLMNLVEASTVDTKVNAVMAKLEKILNQNEGNACENEKQWVRILTFPCETTLNKLDDAFPKMLSKLEAVGDDLLDEANPLTNSDALKIWNASFTANKVMAMRNELVELKNVQATFETPRNMVLDMKVHLKHMKAIHRKLHGLD